MNYLNIIFIIAFSFYSITVAQTNNEIFQKFVDEKVSLDTAIISQLLNMDGEKKLFFDSNNDGKIDVIYMIDNDENNEEWYEPIIVKIIDEDGDMHLTNTGDFDSDIYVADWHADGEIDRITDYKDLDGDNDLDEQFMFYYMDSSYARFTKQSWLLKYGEKPKTYQTKYPGRDYLLHWTQDISDDNLVQWFVNQEIKQSLNQWKCDNRGDERYVNSFVFDYENDRLIPSEELAFGFYDLDGDGTTEEVARFGGTENTIENFRYSMDLDNDARGRKTHDFDLSITCVGDVEVTEEISEKILVRNRLSENVVRWDKIREYGKASQWEKAHLVWDENDNNVAGWSGIYPGIYAKNRWEGVINNPSGYMPLVGGPASGTFNRRNEIDTSYIGQMSFYFSDVDHRYHLYGADVGWIMVDYDYDYKMDMFIWMEDTDGDGFFDTWKYDLDGDSFGEPFIITMNNWKMPWTYDYVVSEDKFERIYTTKNDKEKLIKADYKTMHPLYTEGLSEIVAENQKFINLAKTVLRNSNSNFIIDPIEEYFSTELKNYGDNVSVDQWGGTTLDMHFGRNIREGLDGTRYYQDLIRERYWAKIIKSVPAGKVLDKMEIAYEEGRLSDVNEILENEFDAKNSNELHDYKKQFSIILTNPSDLFLENYPFVISVTDIKRKNPNVDLTNIVLLESNQKIDYRTIPLQIDDLNQDGESDELVFVYSTLPNSSTTLNVYTILDEKKTPKYKTKTAVFQDWLKNSENEIGLESNWSAYRMFNGRMDFLGKKLEGLYLEKKDYHHIHKWGMDVLNLGKSSGLGGISLWEGDSQVRAFNFTGKKKISVEKKVIVSGPVRSMVEVRFSDIKTENNSYEVIMKMSVYAENDFCQQSITINSENGNEIVYSPGIRKYTNDNWLLNTNSGILASWGLEKGQIGEVGLGLIYPASKFYSYSENDYDRYIKLKVQSGEEQTHYILGGWRKGFASPTAPNLENWERDIGKLSRKLKVPIIITIN